MQKIINTLSSLNFAQADQMRDFDQIIPYVYYCLRISSEGGKPHSKFEYVSLVGYSPEMQGKTKKQIQELFDNNQVCFVEAVYEHYLAPKAKNKPKGKFPLDVLQKSGHASFRATLFRNEKELVEFLK